MWILGITALVPSSTSEVEHIFSTMNLVSTPLRAHLLNVNLEHCMCIAKYSKVISDADYHIILKNLIKAESTKSKSRKIESRLNFQKHNYFFLYFCVVLVFVLLSRGRNNGRSSVMTERFLVILLYSGLFINPYTKSLIHNILLPTHNTYFFNS